MSNPPELVGKTVYVVISVYEVGHPGCDSVHVSEDDARTRGDELLDSGPIETVVVSKQIVEEDE